MVIRLLKKLWKDENTKSLTKYSRIVEAVNEFEESVASKTDNDLKAMTVKFKSDLAEGKSLDDILPEAFAVVRETSKRLSGERHFDVQIIGGATIHDGNIAEMRTGEGKTLVATLPTYLNALTGNGVHVVTVNDYLARRDAVWMAQIYDFLGLSVGVINGSASYLYDATHTERDEERDTEGSYKIVYDFLKPCKRTEAYACDVTYGTNSEFGFDYLRDNLEYEKNAIRQKNHAFAIIDEIDSILIDEARTPMIISMPVTDYEDLYDMFAKLVTTFVEDEDYTVDEEHHAIHLTDSGIGKAEKSLNVENIYTEKGLKYVHHLETALKAKALYSNDKEYVVKDGEAIIVDENTGRMQPGRRWSGGLHQAIEAKEGLKTQQESRTFASITYQNYFRMYEKIGGMTGTAKTNAEEFYKVYGLDTITIPTNNTVQRIDENDLIFQNTRGKFTAIAKKIKELHENGQPVLVGTVAIETNELLSEFLKKEGVPHEVLNAKKHESEGEIVAQGGKKGAVTIATNMAGRGVDIKLGGVPFDLAKYEEVKALGGLAVIGTERHDARRIDNQLRGRSGRQGDPGYTQFYVSLDDRLMRVFAGDTVKNMMSKLGMAEDEPIHNRIITKTLENAQNRIEGLNFDARKRVLEYDNVLNTQRNTVYERRRGLLMNENSFVKAEVDKIIAEYPEVKKAQDNKITEYGEDAYYDVLRRVLLQTIDRQWVDHLEAMEYTRSSVALRAYGQREPLIEYKREGLRLFHEFNDIVNDNVRKTIENLQINIEVKNEESDMKKAFDKAKEASKKADGSAKDIPAQKSADEKIGRNEMVILQKDGKRMEVKYKKAMMYLAQGWSLIEKK